MCTSKRQSARICLAIATILSSPVYAQLVEGSGERNSATLIDIRESIEDGEYGNIHSVIATQRGQLVVEWYFTGPDEKFLSQLGNVDFNADTLHDVRSVTKSVVSLLFGIALAEGAVESLDEPFDKYFPDHADLLRPEHSEILLGHLLSMTSGIRWDERTYPYTDPRNSEVAMYLAEDRLQLILSEQISASPGDRFNYSGGDVELVARIIERATEMPLTSFATERLFEPIGIESFEWMEYPSGGPIVASGLRMRPLDMAKIGQLVLQNGRWPMIKSSPRLGSKHPRLSRCMSEEMDGAAGNMATSGG